MAFKFSFLAIGLLTCWAAVRAFEARRLGDDRSFKSSVCWLVPLTTCALVMLVTGYRYHLLDIPRSDHVGFEPGWHCLNSSAKGADFCVKER